MAIRAELNGHDPLILFQEWLAEGKHSELDEMALSVTATSGLRPNAR